MPKVVTSLICLRIYYCVSSFKKEGKEYVMASE